MHIDSYQFGKIVIDGSTYTSDCLIIDAECTPDWRRKQGHNLHTDDLKPILDAAPSILIVGAGASAMMNVPDQTRDFLGRRGIRLEVLATDTAVARFNELSESGESVAAALHLTC